MVQSVAEKVITSARLCVNMRAALVLIFSTPILQLNSPNRHTGISGLTNRKQFCFSQYSGQWFRLGEWNACLCLMSTESGAVEEAWRENYFFIEHYEY